MSETLVSLLGPLDVFGTARRWGTCGYARVSTGAMRAMAAPQRHGDQASSDRRVRQRLEQLLVEHLPGEPTAHWTVACPRDMSHCVLHCAPSFLANIAVSRDASEQANARPASAKRSVAADVYASRESAARKSPIRTKTQRM